ncbi:hypothetical protein BU15DRAFT_67113 [Melanogaster broomeanus]|nr:hypothetical protein BU15DRAFT_67113 [Melanogaster broomeanus]
MVRAGAFLIRHVSTARVLELTIHSERFKVEYVWGAPWTVVKATFLLNRYGNLIGRSFVALEETGILKSRLRRAFGLFGSIFAIFSAESIHILVLMRAWAIWGCTYRVAVLLILLYVIYILAVIGMTIYAATSANFVDFQYLDETGVCVIPIPPLVPVARHRNVRHGHAQSSQANKGHSRPLSLSPATPSSVAFYIMGLTALQASAYNDLFSIVCWTIYSNDPRNVLDVALSYPLLSMVGQRLVLNLRGVQTRPYATHDLSREVDRQMAAMEGTSFWQAVDQWPNGVLEAGHGAQSGVGLERC